MEYKCKKCNKSYASYQSLWIHNKKFHNNMSTVIPVITTENYSLIEPKQKKVYTCEYCNKQFTRRNNMNNHKETICKEKNKTNIDPIILQNEIIELKNEVNKLKNKSTKNITNNNNTNNNNNGMINNIIYINKVGNEDILDLNENEIKEIFDKKLESIVKFVQHLNFNSRLPSNHNFCTTSLEGSYLSVYNTNKSPQDNNITAIEKTNNFMMLKERKKYFFESLLFRSINRMELLYKKYKNSPKLQFNKAKQAQIEEDIEILKTIRDRDMNDTLLREMLKKLNLLSYNYKEIVMKTWNNHDIMEKVPETFEEDLDNDTNNIDMKEIEKIFMKDDSDTDSDSERPQLVRGMKDTIIL